MSQRLRQYGCLAIAGILVVAGTLATGVLPQTTLSQVLAGTIIVAGFALGFVCLGGLEGFE
jgi:fructose-1,6-bisphosphatase/inositol monophosphatase family enzyme